MTKPAQPAKSPPQNGITLGDGVRFAAQSPSVFLRFLCSFFVVLCGAVGSLLTFTSFFSVPVSPFAVALTAVLFSLLFLLLFLWKRGLKFTLPAFALLYGLCVYLQFDRLRDGFCLLYNRTVLSLQARSNWTLSDLFRAAARSGELFDHPVSDLLYHSAHLSAVRRRLRGGQLLGLSAADHPPALGGTHL